MAELWAPSTVQANRAMGLMPVETASAGIRGNRAGQTTPVVELKKLISAPTRLKARGIRNTGTLEPIHALSMSMVPAATATAISIPAPAIIKMVFQGTLAMISFWGASFISSAMTAKTIATRPTSILPATMAIKALPGISSFSTGKIRTTAIMARIRIRVCFCCLL